MIQDILVQSLGLLPGITVAKLHEDELGTTYDLEIHAGAMAVGVIGVALASGLAGFLLGRLV